MNGVMGAKAEWSLLFHVVGMPSYQHQRVHKIAHHTLGDGVFGNFVHLSAMRAVFINRRKRPFGQTPHQPDFIVANFTELAAALV
jgi:TPP-dependent 2-oxoacid decarboxylase